MIGMNAETGAPLDGIDHLRQSIRDILTTPLGSRVMRRDYGSRLYDLVDAPMNRSTILEMYVATADALSKWEPRLSVDSVTASDASAGKVVLSLSGRYVPTGEVVFIDGIEVN